jgi:3-oxoacyl-[acyl-carrier-protein] synthase II
MSGAIVITGGGATTALGTTPDLWARLDAGRRTAGGAADLGLDILPDPVRTRALRAERMTQLVLAAGGRALATARLVALDGPPRPGMGVVLGTAFGCFLSNAAHERRLCETGPASTSPRIFAATVSNAAAGELGIVYRLGGPAVTLTAGTAAGLVALGHAAELLARGRAEALVAGGADALGDDLVGWVVDARLVRGAPPGEGAALVVLETATGARRRGAEVVGTLEGWAHGFDAGGDTAGVVQAALAAAGVHAAALAHVAGTGDDRPALGARLGDTFAAAAPLALLAGLAAVPRGAPVLVVDACASGHVAALVARAGEPA